jgi:hypothetical protein
MLTSNSNRLLGLNAQATTAMPVLQLLRVVQSDNQLSITAERLMHDCWSKVVYMTAKPLRHVYWSTV